jgi:hypothetical protein
MLGVLLSIESAGSGYSNDVENLFKTYGMQFHKDNGSLAFSVSVSA